MQNAESGANPELARDEEPTTLEGQEQLAIQYEEEGEIEEAIGLWRYIEREQTNYLAAPFHLGILYHKTREYTEVVEAFQRAIKIKPNFSDIYYHLGLVYNDLKMDDDAINMYKAVLQLEPGHRDAQRRAHRRLGLTYHRMEMLEEAKKHYQLAGEADTNE